MNEYKAKYEALLLGITDSDMIENAEKLVQSATDISGASAVSFEHVFDALCLLIQKQQTLVAEEFWSNLEDFK